MVDDLERQKYQKMCRYLNIAITLACLAVVGSCVAESNDVGGGVNSNRELAGVFFFHVFLIVPCLFGLFVYLQIKLEQIFLSKDTIEQLNATHMKYARKEVKGVLGPLSPMFSSLFQKNRKK